MYQDRLAGSDRYKDGERGRHALAWIVLLTGLAASFAATAYVKINVERDNEKDLVFHCDQIRNIIEGRLDDQARVLQSAAAVFSAFDGVTREQWHLFSKAHKLEKKLPGIQGIGFSMIIPRAELTAHIQSIRSEGFPDYRVTPEGDRETYTSIVYLEPFSGRNLRAFGYDMFQEPVRRKAMEQARDTDSAALSGKVLLVQETGQDIQPGALMYFPVYRKGVPINSIEERRAAIRGWVYSPYRIDDLLHGMLNSVDLHTNKQLCFQIFDGLQTLPRNLIFDNGPSPDKENRSEGRFTRKALINLNGHYWTLSFTGPNCQPLNIMMMSPWLTLMGGALVTLLLFILIHSLLTTPLQAQRMADELSLDLRKSEKRFRTIFEEAPVGVALIDSHTGQIDSLNPMFAKIAGRTMEEMVRMDWMSITHPDDVQQDLDNMALLNSGKIKGFRMEKRYVRPDGSPVWISMTVAPVYVNDKAHPYHLCMIEDITERKQMINSLKTTLEQQAVHVTALEKASNEIQKLSSIKDEFTSMVSHELRTPLTAMKESLTIVRDGLAGPIIPEQEEFLDLAIQHLKRLSRLIDGILVFQKLQYEDEALEMEKGDLNQLVLTQGKTFEALARTKGMEVVFELDEALPKARFNKDMMAQVLVNLIDNAFKFSDKGRVTVRTEKKDAEVIVSVHDEGIGIKEEDLPKLFINFSQVQNIGRKKISGTGLGLAISKQIINKHGGKVWAESVVGKGSSFYVAIPIVPSPGGGAP